ncbi:DUF2570 family protein [Haemophilus parahaemolyticus]|uniref:DUF2570 family protein n=1 Tax=Haemophilus parahaemolyticus TaxID=735 RepID=UPI00248F5A9F|nr:DUF2570 family protein [Haemophilus parahaemolyticus]
MFSRFNVALTVVILSLCVWLWGQHQTVLHLRAENLAQAQTIVEQEQANANLTIQLEQEIEAVRHQQAIVIELRRQAEVKRESIKTILVKEPCARVPMPRAVIEQLQSKSNNKD